MKQNEIKPYRKLNISLFLTVIVNLHHQCIIMFAFNIYILSVLAKCFIGTDINQLI